MTRIIGEDFFSKSVEGVIQNGTRQGVSTEQEG